MSEIKEVIRNAKNFDGQGSIEAEITKVQANMDIFKSILQSSSHGPLDRKTAEMAICDLQELERMLLPITLSHGDGKFRRLSKSLARTLTRKERKLVADDVESSKLTVVLSSLEEMHSILVQLSNTVISSFLTGSLNLGR